MSGWTLILLGDIVDFRNGLNFSEKNDGVGLPIVKVKNFGDKHFVDHDGLDQINPVGLKITDKQYLQRDDIVIVRSNGNKDLVGRSMIYTGPDERVAFAGFCIRGRVDKKRASPQFVHYWLRSPQTRERFSREGSGTGIQNVSQALLQTQRIRLPPLPEQREIAGILGALDDKIELNRRMAATLEEMARSLYRSWFVDFDPVHAKAAGHPPAHMDKTTAALFPDRFGDDGLPEGWRMGCLADVATNPRTGVKPEQIAPSTPYIGLEHMPKRSITLGDWGTAEDIGSQKSAMRQGDFLFGKLRPYFHKVGVSPVDGICSTDIVVVRARSPEWAGFVLSVISSDDFVEHTNAGSSGTRMPRTNWGDMGRYEVVLPPALIAAAFEDMLGGFRRQIVAGVHENQTLATLRDALLPRLMSGDLRVGAAREMVEDVA